MKLGKYIGNFVDNMLSTLLVPSEERREAYERCFHGTSDEVERKLRTYDSVFGFRRQY